MGLDPSVSRRDMEIRSASIYEENFKADFVADPKVCDTNVIGSWMEKTEEKHRRAKSLGQSLFEEIPLKS